MKFLVALFLSTTAACAADRTPWAEPPLGSVSTTGSSIEVEDYRCTVTSPYSISCLNVGRVCVAVRAEQEKIDARRFGCAIESSKNYPCPKDEPQDEYKSRLRWSCVPSSMGGF